MVLPEEAIIYQTIYAKLRIISNDLLKESSKVKCIDFNITLRWLDYNLVKKEKYATICFKDGKDLKILEFQIPVQLADPRLANHFHFLTSSTAIRVKVETKAGGLLSDSGKANNFAIEKN